MAGDEVDGDVSAMPELEAFRREFLERSEERIRRVYTLLLSLEEQLERGEADPTLLDELLRVYHTLKGLGGSVGLPAVSELSHELEAVLRRVRAGEQALTVEVIDALIQGTRALEGMLRAESG